MRRTYAAMLAIVLVAILVNRWMPLGEDVVRVPDGVCLVREGQAPVCVPL